MKTNNMPQDGRKSAVLFCFHDSNRFSGATRSLLDIIDNLLEIGEFEIIAAFPKTNGSAIDYLKNKGVYIIPFCYRRWDFEERNSFFKRLNDETRALLRKIITYKFLKKIGPILSQKKIRVIYCNTITVQIGALIKKTYGVQLIWHIREFGYEDHRICIVGGTKKLYKALNQYADKVICISNSLANKYGNYIDSEKIFVLYNDISRDYIIDNHPKLELGRQCNILIAGAMQPTKGQLDVIKAVEGLRKDYPQVHLFIAGQTCGAYYNELYKYIQEHKLMGCIHFTGFITDMNVLRRKMDIAVIASSSEAFGRVTVEAMLSGLLVIGADCGATSELIKDGYSGYLYTFGDIENLRAVIISAINDSEGSQRVTYTGQKEAIEKYTTGKCSRVVNDMIKELVSEKKKSDG